MIRHLCALAALAALSFTAACAAEAGDEATEVEETNEDLASRSARFETFQGLDGQYYFHMLAPNGQNVLRSQGYASEQSARKGIESVLASGCDKHKFVIEQAQNGDAYFNLHAGNGEVIGSSELYASVENAKRGASRVRALVRIAQLKMQTAPATQGARFEIFSGDDHQFYFHLRAANGEIVLASEGYVSKSDAMRGASVVLASGAASTNFELVPAADGSCGLRLLAGNGHVIARGETYASKSNATRAIARISELLQSGVAVGE